MSRSLIDKIVLYVLTVLIAAGDIVMGSEQEISIRVVVAALITAIIYGISELISLRYAPYIYLVAALASFWVIGDLAVFVLPAAAYAISSDTKRNIVLRIGITALMCVLALFTDIEKAIPGVALCILACYLAISTAYFRETNAMLIAEYDSARETAFREQQKRRRAIESSENDAYLATLKERNRIAREIHDNVGHMLTRSIVQMEAVRVINRDENIKPYLDSVSESVNNAMTSIRRSVHELHDDSIDLSLGLNDMIKNMDPRFDCRLVTSIDSPTSNEFKNMVLGIVKEALTNISKYSKGDKVRVEVVENNTFWRIYVWDNGENEERDYSDNGFDINGIGLDNIRSRSERFGGKTRIFAGKDGFTVLATVPKETEDD